MKLKSKKESTKTFTRTHGKPTTLFSQKCINKSSMTALSLYNNAIKRKNLPFSFREYSKELTS
jgi:hypothetical protein